MREKKKPKRSKVRLWCPGGGKVIGCECHNPVTKFIRCEVCGQRFEPYYRMDEHDGEKFYYMPKHKAY